MEWEVIDRFHVRAKVFRGWLVKAYEYQEHAHFIEEQGHWTRDQSSSPLMAITFMPDAKHEWEIINE